MCLWGEWLCLGVLELCAGAVLYISEPVGAAVGSLCPDRGAPSGEMKGRVLASA